MSIRATVISLIQDVAAEQKKSLAPLHDDLQLADSGLDSLCFAILVARLEDATGVDPFSSTDGTPVPVTIRDLVALYDRFVV
jgi:acyl carrier protein